MKQIQVSKEHNLNIKLVLMSGFISAGLILLSNFQTSAITWPSTDNLPAVCRMLDSACLTSDFFTNASSVITPRFPYTFLLSGVTSLVPFGLGGGLAVIKGVLLAFLPALWCMVLIYIAIFSLRNPKFYWLDNYFKVQLGVLALIIPAIIFLLQGSLGLKLSVAWWPPLSFDATPQNFSLLICLFSSWLYSLNKRFLCGFLFFWGGIIHPAATIFFAIYFGLLIFDWIKLSHNIDLLTKIFMPTLVASLCATYFFGGGNVNIGASDFAKIYALEAHSGHYIPSKFGSLSPYPWQKSFSIICIGLFILSCVLYKLKSHAWKNAITALLVYSGAIFCQYAFVEIYPIKIIAQIGPSRFSMFGPWLLVSFLLTTIALLYSRLPKATERYLDLLSQKIIAIPTYIFGVILIGIIISILLYSTSKNSYQIIFPDKSGVDLGNFAENYSKMDDVFALPFFAPRVEFPLITKRAIFFGNGFPFSEKYFSEWDYRNANINGRIKDIENLPGGWIGDKYSFFYNGLTPNDFVKMSKVHRLDWVVLYPENVSGFQNCKKSYDNSGYQIYSIVDLEKCISN
ncbi:hypothetical protein C2740_01690 [Polynucleobacter sp. MG-5-Ahmo-C2]|uniref:hypothetical protein n=1 Tax=Polynucleobacter sp. MG-5-Ahmo-C2 TaxID=2081051 RepID=UPI001BFE209E|nr:hypothetical protein [Polynucleobacter sp. MG-5-Ahmo-C2]QWD98825.1 hypothetical protein C2740_01690 [Polynucleobacter sp. MG-5-Ahmo-C2]